MNEVPELNPPVKLVPPIVEQNAEGNGRGDVDPGMGLGWYDTIALPRWVVYVQAGLLGVVATIFFVFGMLVGTMTSQSGSGVAQGFDCRVVGSVTWRDDGDLRADDGAVVLLLPVNRKPDERSNGALVNPLSFKALDNLSIDRIHELGGAVVRTDENGQFDVFVDGSSNDKREYYCCVVSRHVENRDGTELSKQQRAMIGTFFIPVEDVMGQQAVYTLEFVADAERVDLPEFEF